MALRINIIDAIMDGKRKRCLYAMETQDTRTDEAKSTLKVLF